MNIELPKDAEGREIPLDTEVLFDKDGQEIEVSRWQYYPRVGSGYWNLKSARNKYYRQDEVYLAPPDSWEKLLEDLDRGVKWVNYGACKYFGKGGVGTCSSCIADKNESCEQAVYADIASRIRRLRGEG